MMMKNLFLVCLILLSGRYFSQLPVGYDTLRVLENGKVLYSSVCGGIN